MYFPAGGVLWRADLSRGTDISIPLRFDGPQPNAYDVDEATSRPCMAGSFVGDVRRGGSCNFESHTLVPHCNGTHTECIGHIAHERISVQGVLRDALVRATLVTLAPVPALKTPESYLLVKEDDDLVLTASAIREALAHAHPDFLQALVIRTLPNDDGKRVRRYSEQPAPFFTVEAMHEIVARGVVHLVTDIPSLDRAFDEGRLSAHHVFWNVEAGSHDIDPSACSARTVTELAYIPGSVADGAYLLNLQIAPFVSDASPSRPMLYPVVATTAHIPGT